MLGKVLVVWFGCGLEIYQLFGRFFCFRGLRKHSPYVEVVLSRLESLRNRYVFEECIDHAVCSHAVGIGFEA